MPNEFEEIQPAAEEPVEPASEGADTISGDEASLVGADSVDVSDTMAESSFVSGQEEAPAGAPMMTGRAAAPFETAKPRSNIFTLLLILSFLCIVLAIYLLAHELNNYYGVTFGGMLSPPNKISETTGTEK